MPGRGPVLLAFTTAVAAFIAGSLAGRLSGQAASEAGAAILYTLDTGAFLGSCG